MFKKIILRTVTASLLLNSCSFMRAQEDDCDKIIKQTENLKAPEIYWRTGIIALAEKLRACGISPDDDRFKELFSYAQDKASIRMSYAILQNMNVNDIDADCPCIGHGPGCC